MNLKPITEETLSTIAHLASECFIDDPFYRDIATSPEQRLAALEQIFIQSIRICIKYGYAYYYEQDGKSSAFALWFNYNKLKKQDKTAYNHIFPVNHNSPIHKKIQKELYQIDDIICDNTEYLYLLAIGVTKNFRRQGIATRMIESVQKAYPEYNLFADLSNRQSAKLYQRLGFELIGEESACIFTHYQSKMPVYNFSRTDEIHLALPMNFPLDSFLNRVPQSTAIQIPYLQTIENETYHFFKQSLYHHSEARLVTIDYDELLNFQRLINVSKYQELKKTIYEKTILLYTSLTNDRTLPKISSNTKRILTTKKEEWELIPDFYISIPIRYNNVELLKLAHSKHDTPIINQILRALNFRTKYEAGIPIQELENRNFKYRIRRYYIGTINVQIQAEEEISFCGGHKTDVNNIGVPMEMEMIVSIDQMTQTGVLHIVALSCGLLTTQLLDSISRNQLNIQRDSRYENLYQYLKREFDIEKKGAPKSFITTSKDRKEISDNLLASILFCETFYEDGEVLGTVIDTEIVKKLASKNGLAQYNYASVYAYTNVAIQLSSTLAGNMTERIVKESITLFYIELILFEEAAIHIANDKIITFLTQLDKYSPDTVLKSINKIISSHMRTIEFWDIQMNYPSSKKSIDDLRRAFKIRKEQEVIERNKTQLFAIYQIRSSIIDRTESSILSAAGIILTVISVIDIITDNSKSPVLSAVALIVGILLILKRYFFQRLLNYTEK